MVKISDIAEDQICFYDIETSHQYAPYCELKMTGVQYGLNSEPELVESWGEKKRFRETLANPEVIKVAFNNINFDDLVLYRHGFPVCETNRHDLFLVAKTVAPRLPAYSLKFINWFYFEDCHWPEFEINKWLKKNRKENLWEAPKELLTPYCLYDVTQTVQTFCLFWEVVQRQPHWRAYTELELPMGIVIEEMMLRGGEFLDEKLILDKIATLQVDKLGWEDFTWKHTKGRVQNPNSTKQVGEWLVNFEKIELELTDKGNFSLKREDILDFLDIEDHSKDKSQVVRALYEVRQINNTLSYYNNYLNALNHSISGARGGWIPKQYSLSGARTRRILSNSFYKLNFQNPNKAAKEVIIIPSGWLGFWWDATQVENIIHIYESGDEERRQAYEEDEEWNEYVWLANIVLGKKYTKKQLDNEKKMPFPANPTWSWYKGMKTNKLAINFGMGPRKYAKMRHVALDVAKKGMELVHRACPSIKGLQKIVAERLMKDGYVQDVFGHIYSGEIRQAYKIVAYLIQGCGTGSLPKAQMRANYDTLHQWDEPVSNTNIKTSPGQMFPKDVVVDSARGVVSYGVLNGTTHDENSGRISLALGTERIIATLQEMHYNMTKKFSPLFDNIPLRAKLYLAPSNAYAVDREEVDINDTKAIKRIINEARKNTTRSNDRCSNRTTTRTQNVMSRMSDKTSKQRLAR